MISTIPFHIKELDNMKKYPQELFYIGNLDLLNTKKVSIVGTRKPNQYTKQLTYELSKKLSSNSITIVSGAALGVDAIAHSAANTNTIAVAGTGLDIRYPAVNKNLIEQIEKEALIISQFKEKTPSTKYNFPIRNEVVVALGDVLIVTQADLNSGTMRSVEFALKMNKPIFVLSHRIGESEGTTKLLKENLAQPIYDIDEFVKKIAGDNTIYKSSQTIEDKYFLSSPTYDEAMEKYPQKVFEYELSGKIEVKNGKIIVKSQL